VRGGAVRVRGLGARAQDMLDPSFGTGGSLTLDFGAIESHADSGQLAQDGSIILGAAIGSDEKAAVVKLTPAGMPDRSFGTGGEKLIPLPNGLDQEPSSVGATSDGGAIAVVTGWYHGQLSTTSVVRLTASGELDPSFAGHGILEPVPGLPSVPWLALVDGSDRTWLVGENGAEEAFVARLTGGGALDASFGTGGVATAKLPFDVFSIALTPAGGIELAGDTLSGHATIPAARFTASGALDSSFGMVAW
jgi:uncharacterized delta-60 repeat protein